MTKNLHRRIMTKIKPIGNKMPWIQYSDTWDFNENSDFVIYKARISTRIPEIQISTELSECSYLNIRVIASSKTLDPLSKLLAAQKFGLTGVTSGVINQWLDITLELPGYESDEWGVDRRIARLPEVLTMLCVLDPRITEISSAISTKSLDMASAISLSTVAAATISSLIPSSVSLGTATATFFSGREEKPRDESIPKGFECPILHTLMKEPVILTLDGRSYEKSAITTWLETHRNSPFNRKMMEPSQTIETVLVPNLALATAIEEFKAAHSELFNEDGSARTLCK